MHTAKILNLREDKDDRFDEVVLFYRGGGKNSRENYHLVEKRGEECRYTMLDGKSTKPIIELKGKDAERQHNYLNQVRNSNIVA